MPPALQNPIGLWAVLTALLAALVYAFVRRELRTRATAYGSLILACIVAFWPPYDRNGQPGRIKLGLDLRGGIHLVMQVMTDDALQAMTDDGVQTSRELLSQKGITFTGAERTSLRAFLVNGVDGVRVKDAREILEDHFRPPDWEVRETDNNRFAVQMTDTFVHNLRNQTVQEAIRTLERRVNQLGVSEPVIAQQGSSGDQILIQ